MSAHYSARNPIGAPDLFLDGAISKARTRLLESQRADGSWLGLLEGNAGCDSQYILLQSLLGRTSSTVQRLATGILRRQNRDGGWPCYQDGPSQIDVTALCAAALTDLDREYLHQSLERANKYLSIHGGYRKCSGLTRLLLASLGARPWRGAPHIPGELLILPGIGPISLSFVPAWVRQIAVPACLLSTTRPPSGLSRLVPSSLKAVAKNSGISRLFSEFVDQSYGCEILPSLALSAVALNEAGSPELSRQAIAAVERLVERRGEKTVVQPCLSATWDTAWSLRALIRAGVPKDHPAVLSGLEWLHSRQSKDGGWSFGLGNSRYPDADDTAVVLHLLDELGLSGTPRFRHGLEWLSCRQNKDGGWPAFWFARGRLFERLGFADSGSVRDESCADITGKVLGTLRRSGGSESMIRAALRYMVRTRSGDGTWTGRWGVNFIYGTWNALEGIGDSCGPHFRVRSVEWLTERQNPDGGWGESPSSYSDSSMHGRGSSTATQTSWALLALLAALSDPTSRPVQRGIQYLMETQKDDGTWSEDAHVGTGFPGFFYLKYEMYPHYFPLLALATFQRALKRG